MAGGVSCQRSAPDTTIPVVQDYRDLPPEFAATLRDRIDAITSAEKSVEAVRRLARLYHANRFYKEAEECYEVIDRGPTILTARDHYHRADIARNLGDLGRAQKELRKLVQMQPEYIAGRLALAEVLEKSGKAEAALQEFTAVLALEPNQLQAEIGLARLEQQNGDEDAALARLNDVMAAHPGSTAAAAVLAPILRRRGESERADALVILSQQRPEPPPDDPWMNELVQDTFDIRLLGLQAEDHFRFGRSDAGRALLERIEVLDPMSPVPALIRGQVEALAHRHDAAVAQFRVALEKGGDPETLCPSVWTSLLALGKMNEAVAFLAGYYVKLPHSTPIAKAYAAALLKAGDVKTARAVLEKVVASEPYAREENMRLAEILWSQGERDAAAKCLQRVASAHSDDIPARALLGEYHLGKSDSASAIGPLEEAMQLAPSDNDVRQSLAELLVTAYIRAALRKTEQGKLGESTELFEKATRAASASAEAFAGLANLYVLQSRFADAADALEHLDKLRPGNPTIALSLGDVYAQIRRPAVARQHWQRALDLAASNDVELRGALESRLRGEWKGEQAK